MKSQAAQELRSGLDTNPAESAGNYAIQVHWSATPINDEELPMFNGSTTIRVYRTKEERNGLIAYGIRVGFFQSEKSASALLQRLKKRYPNAQVISVQRQAFTEKRRSMPSGSRPEDRATAVPPPATSERLEPVQAPSLPPLQQVEIALREAPARKRMKLASRADQIFYLLMGVALVTGWQLRDEQYLVAESGTGYAFGIIGGLLMLMLFLYPVRKRMRSPLLGPIKLWFRTHIILGVLGPVFILFHSNFQFGSFNSTVALASMLLVAASGFFGRYFYAKIHYGLFGRKATLAGLHKDVSEARSHHAVLDLIKTLNERLMVIEKEVMEMPCTVLESTIRPIKLAVMTRSSYFSLKRFAHQELNHQADSSRLIADNLGRLKGAVAHHIAERLQKVRKVAEFGLYEHLFRAWHVFHYPFFFILVVSAVIHVIAVHLY